MFGRLNKIRDRYDLFKAQAKEYSAPCNWRIFARYVLASRRYGVTIMNFFQYRLWDKNADASEFLSETKDKRPTWKNAASRFVPNASPYWLLTRRIDFCISKYLYPGLNVWEYFEYEFYRFRREKRRTFITTGYLGTMTRHFNGAMQNNKYLDLLSDKKEFNLFFADFVKRGWIVSNETSLDDFIEFCRGKSKVIVKPTLGAGGGGIFVASVETEPEIRALYEKVSAQRYMVEDVLKQCDELARLNPSSVNTARVYSVFYRGEVYVVAATLRVGRGDAAVDNFCAGGLAAEIDVELGVVKTRAVSKSGVACLIHPDTRQPIIGAAIPRWQEAREAVKKAHERIPQLRYIAWDVVVCEDGSIEFLEANFRGCVGLQQAPGLDGKKDLYRRYW